MQQPGKVETEAVKTEARAKTNSSIKVVIDQNRCIGNGACVDAAPKGFKLDNKKAVFISEKAELETGTLKLRANPTEEELQGYIEAGNACPVNAIRVVNQANQDLVQVEVKKDQAKVIIAEYDDLKEFVMDSNGYFLIDTNPERKEIMIGFCPEVNKVSVKIIGRKPLEIYQTAIKEDLISRMDHAAYLGRELQKAFIALQAGKPYVQDDELSFSSEGNNV